MSDRSNKPFMARQGDILIMRVGDMPEGAEFVEKDKVTKLDTLALGEVSGHHHSVADPEASTMFIDNASSTDELLKHRYLSITEDTEVTHQEHHPIPLGPGIYKVMRQVEYQPEGYRAVAD